MDVGTGSGILAVWAAQAGARRVYAIEYTDMAKHAKSVMEANGVADVVTVIQAAVEDVELPSTDFPGEDSTKECVDIIISEWMGYFLLRESMVDSLIRARDKFLKKGTGIMYPSHATMLLAPITDEEERKINRNEYNGAMGDWQDFVEATKGTYGVDMSVLDSHFEREQREYYLLSSRWAEFKPSALLAPPQIIKSIDMHTCTLADCRGISLNDTGSAFDFEIVTQNNWEAEGPISGFAGWFTVDFKSRDDEEGMDAAPKIIHPVHLTTGPEGGYTHWGQQAFHLNSCIPLISGETTRLKGSIELKRTKENVRLYNCRIAFQASRRKNSEPPGGTLVMQSNVIEHIYQIP
jgi:protein arginine N-methyltransferase 1